MGGSNHTIEVFKTYSSQYTKWMRLCAIHVHVYKSSHTYVSQLFAWKEQREGGRESGYNFHKGTYSACAQDSSDHKMESFTTLFHLCDLWPMTSNLGLLPLSIIHLRYNMKGACAWETSVHIGMKMEHVRAVLIVWKESFITLFSSLTSRCGLWPLIIYCKQVMWIAAVTYVWLYKNKLTMHVHEMNTL